VVHHGSVKSHPVVFAEQALKSDHTGKAQTMLNASTRRAAKPATVKTTEAAPPAARAGRVHVKLSAGEMPIIRTSGDMAKWKKLHGKTLPFKSAMSGTDLIAEMRTEREARCS
jgi:hypothetical protein